MCQSRRRGRGLHVIKGKGMLVVKKLESNRPWIPIWAWFSEQLSCTRVMAFSPTSYFCVSLTNQSGLGTVKRSTKTRRATCLQDMLQNELNRHVAR